MEKKILINVGRQFGSGGKSVAIELGERLGIPVYDNELLVKAAQQSGLCQEMFHGSDEHKHTLSLGNLFSSNRFGSFTQSGISESDLFKIQSDTIREIASEGSAIFVGRASDYILRDMECLDVFISADDDDRIKRIASRMSVSEEEAEKIMRKKDKSRKEYYDFFTFGDNWGRAANYDLCINSSKLGIEKTAGLIISFGGFEIK